MGGERREYGKTKINCELMTPPEKPRKGIGFVVKERRAAYGKRTKKGGR